MKEEGFQQPVSSQGQEKIENAKYIFASSKQALHVLSFALEGL